LSLSESTALSVECFPFELNREAQVVLYLADASDLVYRENNVNTKLNDGLDEDSNRRQDDLNNAERLDTLEDEVRASRYQYRRAILHQLLVFDVDIKADSPLMRRDVLFVPTPERSRSTTIKTMMCDVTGRLLHSMDNLAHEVQDLSTIESPSSAPASKYTATDIAERVHARMSAPGVPIQASTDLTSARNPAILANISRSSTPAGARSASRHSAASPNRNDRLSEVPPSFGSRDASRDRKSVISPTVTTPTERKKNRSIARRHIVTGALYLQAGLWPDAIKELSEGTAIARSNNDYIWHAKGLEYIIACLLMFGWAEMYFQVRRSKPVSTMPN
jgi:trafficking protein particle complex subunit 9